MPAAGTAAEIRALGVSASSFRADITDAEQAKAILDMRLQRLTGLEREKIDITEAEVDKALEYLREAFTRRGFAMQVIETRYSPVLIGTRSVEASERLSVRLHAQGIEHVVLNARNDREEAEIVAEAVAYVVGQRLGGGGTGEVAGSAPTPAQ